VGVRFSTLLQTGPGAYPASYSMDNGPFLRANGWGVAITTHIHVTSRLKCGSLLFLLCAFMAFYRATFIFSPLRGAELEG